MKEIVEEAREMEAVTRNVESTVIHAIAKHMEDGGHVDKR